MTTPAAGLTPRSARLFHLVLAAQTVGWVVVLAVLFTVMDVRPLDDPSFRWIVRAAGVVLFGVVAVATALVGRAVTREPDPDRWWQANGARMRMLWVIADGVSLAGVLLYLLSGVLLALLPFLAGVATLVLQRPTKVVEA